MHKAIAVHQLGKLFGMENMCFNKSEHQWNSTLLCSTLISTLSLYDREGEGRGGEGRGGEGCAD